VATFILEIFDVFELRLKQPRTIFVAVEWRKRPNTAIAGTLPRGLVVSA
jgi:hypothetical protein